MDVLVLGPVQLWAGEKSVGIDRPLERAVLVRLALAGGVPVPDGRLAEDLWGADVERPVQRLRVVVSRFAGGARHACGRYRADARRISRERDGSGFGDGEEGGAAAVYGASGWRPRHGRGGR
ncbi:hypothetical protein [Nocardia sp. CA-135398]|uniref:hypothetical protein n=1 Tax=Nocardia sp. CA-135398 TaxID=3239977 RepID=UPI003D96D490